MAAFALGSRIEVVQVAQQVAGGVANLAVHICQLFHNARPEWHIGGVIHRTHPQAQHIGAVGRLLLFVFAPLHQHRWIHHIAQGFAHLAALLIQREAVGEHRFVWRRTVHGH